MHTQVLSTIRCFSEADPDVIGLLLFGSVARGDATARSDLDVAVVTRASATTHVRDRLMSALRGSHPTQVIASSAPVKVALFTQDMAGQVEAYVVADPQEIVKLVVGSRLPDPRTAVVVDKVGTLLTWAAALEPESDVVDDQLDFHLKRFQLSLQAGSRFHAASDGIRAQREFQIAFESVARLAYLLSGGRGFVFAPRRLLVSVLPEPLRGPFRTWVNPADCALQYATKSGLVRLLEAVVDHYGFRAEASIRFCKAVLARDRFWNLRDSAELVDPRLRKGVLFRGASPHHQGADPEYAQWLCDRNVALRVDLRAPHEHLRDPAVPLELPSLLAPIDPWTHFAPDDPLHLGATSREASYRFSALRCPEVLRALVRAIVTSPGAILVHCYAGRDRTGVMVALLQLAAGADRSGIVNGFSLHADAEDTQNLSRVLDYLDAMGGIAAVFDRAGVPQAELVALRERLLEAP
jgi:hypothetical protein